VQDPAEAEHSSMPRSALANIEIDHCLPISEIAPLLVALTQESAGEEGGSPARIVTVRSSS
jgi:two-component system chemotaxis response regulator CheB